MHTALPRFGALPIVVLWFGGLMVACASGCGGPLAEGGRALEQGRYAEALTALRESEGSARAWHGERRARYALYRGLAHLALGDRESTLRWLGEAKAATDAHPTLLDDSDAGRLAAAWAHLPQAWLEAAERKLRSCDGSVTPGAGGE